MHSAGITSAKLSNGKPVVCLQDRPDVCRQQTTTVLVRSCASKKLATIEIEMRWQLPFGQPATRVADKRQLSTTHLSETRGGANEAKVCYQSTADVQ